MKTPKDRMVTAMIDALSDSRTIPVVAMNELLDEADRNDHIQGPLFQLVVSYLYNRATRWRLQIAHTPQQRRVAEVSYDIVTQVLEYLPENTNSAWKNGLVVSGRAYDPPDIF